MPINKVKTFKGLHYAWHILIAGVIRLALIAYAEYHDRNFAVPYTDVDYKVFTDAARHVYDGGSPYDRHTFRYTPLIAYTLIPNVVLHPCFGKVLFALMDLVIGALLRTIVWKTLTEYENYVQKSEGNILQLDDGAQLVKPNLKYLRGRKKSKGEKGERLIKQKTELDMKADVSMMIWLYNPIAIAISTRGNSDSIAGFLVLLTIYCLQCLNWCFVAGVLHGLAVHIRLYPLIYSLAFFMYLSKYSFYSPYNQSKKIKVEERKTIFKKAYLLYLIPNFNQLKLISGCVLTLVPLTYSFYTLYGYKFLYETYIYHVVRKDTRHNFSLFFYLQYLTAGVKNIGLWQKILITLPQFVLLIVFSIRYGLNKFSMSFSVLTLTIIAVIYNTVLTSQYFVWILVVLPLSIWQVKMSRKSVIFLGSIWAAAQLAWLMPAYFLEFQGQNTFMFIWVQGVSFFCANIAILGRLIMNYNPVKRSKVC